jgi:hypothetical protein
MILSTQQILYYFIFILFISLITVYCIKCNNTNINNNINNNNSKISNKKIYENFENTNNDDYFTDFTDSEIINIELKNSINNKLSSLKSIITKYSVLDPAITINNNNILCDSSAQISNNCKIIDNSKSNDPTCLSDNVPISCSRYFDEYIKQQINIDLSSLKTRENIIVKASQLINSIDTQDDDIKYNLDTYISNLKIEDQQKTFINYNIINLDDKAKLLNKTTEDYEKNENDINVNQVNFTNFLSKNNNNIAKINFYYNIIIYVVIAIIVVGIFNFFITKPEE